MKKATKLTEIDNAVQFNVPVGPDHAFFTDFSQVRGDFEEKVVYRSLNVNTKDFTFDPYINQSNKTVLFLSGMRGSGKTSELKKYVQKLEGPNCFFTVTCDVDQFDTKGLEYMDILILQLEELMRKASQHRIQLDEEVIDSMHEWFRETVKEINATLNEEAGIDLGGKAEIGLPGIFKILSQLKAGITGTYQRATKIRDTFKNRFSDYASKFNAFIEEVNTELRNSSIAQEVLFVVDGLEKTYSSEVRRKIIMDEANRILQIKANTIFTLPIELSQEAQKIKMHSEVVSFPFVKVCDQRGNLIENAVVKFEDFVYKRISSKLFDKPETVRKAIKFGGGSPRELLRLLGHAKLYASDDKDVIDEQAMNKAINKLANQTAQHITEKDIEMLKKLKENNKLGRVTTFDEEGIMQRLLENLIVMEYNDGTYKRVNPLVEVSEIYQQYVG